MILNKKNILKLLTKLYPINRSITGDGYIQSLNIISNYIPFKFIKFKTGEKIYDWEIPLEWNIDDAYIKTPDGKKITEFKKNNLHILNYSIPIKNKIKFNELKKKLYTIKEIPNAIPYVHSYYKRDWGFSIKYNDYKKLKKQGLYEVYINSSLKKGKLVVGEYLLKGRLKKEILFSTYLCHPQMANHELSGPLMMILIYDYIKKIKNRKYSYRFVICPENIGSLAYLKRRGKELKKNVEAGLILNCLANGEEFTYKKTKNGNETIDKIIINCLKHSGEKYKIVDFFPDGSDERMYSSQGFNLQVSSLMRKMYDNLYHPNNYPEYHTSLDNLKFFNMDTFFKTFDMYKKVIDTYELNFKPKAKVIYGTPMLSKYDYNLYPSKMDFSINKRKEEIRILLEILNLSDSKKDLIDMAIEKNFSLLECKKLINKLLSTKLIQK